jgi:Carboxypeptidase regulatory-like domain/Putative Ig domain
MISKRYLPAGIPLNLSFYALFFITICFNSISFAASSITPASGVLPNGAVGHAYSQTFVAITNNGWNCVKSTNWVNVTNGLSFNASSGILSGTPTTSPAIYNFTVTVTCSNPAGNQSDVVTNNYSLKIVTVSAADVKIGGRIVDSTGRGIFRARVSLFDANTGLSYFSSTNPFGYFRIHGVESGDFCILEINNKRFTFDSVSFIANENLEDLLIVPN